MTVKRDMPKPTTQVKFTVDSGIADAFKARCADAGVSMTSVIKKFMITCQPTRDIKTRALTRPNRKEAVLEIIGLLSSIATLEMEYRDNIPEQFQQRYETADHACDQLAEAISCLEDAY